MNSFIEILRKFLEKFLGKCGKIAYESFRKNFEEVSRKI